MIEAHLEEVFFFALQFGFIFLGMPTARISVLQHHFFNMIFLLKHIQSLEK